MFQYENWNSGLNNFRPLSMYAHNKTFQNYCGPSTVRLFKFLAHLPVCVEIVVYLSVRPVYLRDEIAQFVFVVLNLFIHILKTLHNQTKTYHLSKKKK